MLLQLLIVFVVSESSIKSVTHCIQNDKNSRI